MSNTYLRPLDKKEEKRVQFGLVEKKHYNEAAKVANRILNKKYVWVEYSSGKGIRGCTFNDSAELAENAGVYFTKFKSKKELKKIIDKKKITNPEILNSDLEKGFIFVNEYENWEDNKYVHKITNNFENIEDLIFYNLSYGSGVQVYNKKEALKISSKPEINGDNDILVIWILKYSN